MSWSGRARLGGRIVGVCAVLSALVLVGACSDSARTTTEPSGTVDPARLPPVSGSGNDHPLPVGVTSAEATYTLVFDDEFDGPQIDEEKWNPCHWWAKNGCTIASNDELEWYLPSQIHVEDSVLHLTADAQETEGHEGTMFPYRSGMVSTGPPDSEGTPAKFSFTYGTAEVRFRVPEGDGLWPAFWMLPASRESRPEIDVVEILGNDPTELLMHVHPKDRDRESDGEAWDGSDFSAQWHVVRLDWRPGALTWSVDGDPVWNVEGDHVPSEPMYLVLNLAVGGAYPGDPGPDTAFPATFAIDYVRVWQTTP